MKSFVSIVSLLLFLIVTIVSTPASAKTIPVPGDHQRSIQDGLDLAEPGDIVLVADGTYHENIIWPAVDGIWLWHKGDPSKCTIDGMRAGSVIEMTMDPLATGDSLTKVTVLDGFTLTNGKGTVCSYSEESSVSASCGGGLLVQRCSPTIRNLRIRDNEADLGGGIFLGYSSATIKNNEIAADRLDLTTGNEARKGGGLYLFESSPAVVNNTIVHNKALLEGGGGGLFAENSGASVVNSIIYYNSLPPVVETGEKGHGLSISFSCVEEGWDGFGAE